MSIELLENIHYISLSSHSNYPTIDIGSRHSLAYLNIKSPRNISYYSIQIPNSKTYLSKKSQFFSKGLVSSIHSYPVHYTYEQTHLMSAKQGKKHTKIKIKNLIMKPHLFQK